MSNHKELLDFLVRSKVHVALNQESKLQVRSSTPTFSGYSTLCVDRPGDVGGGGLLARISRQISYTHRLLSSSRQCQRGTNSLNFNWKE